MGTVRPGVVLAVVCLALGTVMAGVSSTNVALPAIGAATGAGQTTLVWIVDAYSLCFVLLLLPSGTLGDRFGRRRLLLLGLAVFGSSSLAASVANGADTLVVLRVVMGIGAALVMPATLSTITATFPPERRSRAVAIWTMVAAGAGALGVITAGVGLLWFSYRSIFILGVVMAALAFTGTLFWVPETRRSQARRVDVVGALLSVAGLAPVVYSIIEAPVAGWFSTRTVAGIVGGTALLGCLIGWELRCRSPLLDPRLLLDRRFTAGAVGVTMQFFVVFGFSFVFLQYLQLVEGDSALHAGLAMLPFVVGLGPGCGVAVWLCRRMRPGLVAAGGLTIVAAASAMFCQADPGSSYLLTFCGVTLLGAGLGMASLPSTMAITDALPPDEQGVASAVNDLTRELGAVLGIAVTGSVLASVYRSGLHLPAGPLVARAHASLAVALHQGPAVADPAKAAFVHAAHAAYATTALVSLAAALAVLVLTVMRSPKHETARAGYARSVA